MRFETSPSLDPAAERAIMAATAIAHEFDRVAATATAILIQVCSDGIVAAKRVEGTINLMFSRGALEREDGGVAVRFEHLCHVNRARIRAKQKGFGWPPNAATLVRETPEPWLPVANFVPRMQDALRHFLANGLIASSIREGEVMIAESDYLICHMASLEGPFRPLAAFSDNPAFVDLLLAEHADDLVVRNGVISVPWHVVNDYSAPGASPLCWELDPQDIPISGPV
jgi:hypothetical protein